MDSICILHLSLLRLNQFKSLSLLTVCLIVCFCVFSVCLYVCVHVIFSAHSPWLYISNVFFFLLQVCLYMGYLHASVVCEFQCPYNAVLYRNLSVYARPCSSACLSVCMCVCFTASHNLRLCKCVLGSRV